MSKMGRYYILGVICIGQLVACTGCSDRFYNKKDIEIVALLAQNDSKYLIFDTKNPSSLNWPENALCTYNSDSTKVKLSIRRYSAMLSNRKPDTNSNIRIVKNCIDLKLSYKNSEDSLRKGFFYVIKLPISVSEVKISNWIF